MAFEEMGSIKYGELRFLFNVSDGVVEFLKNNEVEVQNIMPTSQMFYQTVAYKMGLDYTRPGKYEVYFFGVSTEGAGVEDLIEGDFEIFQGFPFTIKDDIYFLNFGVREKSGGNIEE